jgi:phospholipid/cholesterol/gamma-HCH transport system substrate-binding protein
MRQGPRPTLIKFGIFAVVMVLLTASLFFIFGQYQTGSRTKYSAVFTDVSRLEPGQSVRVAGMRVGTVDGVRLRPDKTVAVTFDVDSGVRMTTGTRVAVLSVGTPGVYRSVSHGGSRVGISPWGTVLSVGMYLSVLRGV